VVSCADTSESSPLRFRVLGALEADVDGLALELGGRKQRAVLAALLLRAGEVVRDERLIDDVWGDGPPASAAHGLEAYISRLRGVLAPHGVLLRRGGGGYRLDLGPAVVDARDFARLVEDAAQASAADEHDRAAALATSALELWHGPVLSGVPLFLDARAQAERLEELRWQALEIRIDADLALGRHAAIVGELRRLVGESPYRERLVAQLMLALYRSGRQAEALEVYECTRRTLADDLGLQPSEELQQLSGQIVRQEPPLRAPARASHGSERRHATRTRTTWAAAALVGALVAVIGVVLGLTIPTDAGVTGTHSTARVALLALNDPGLGSESDETFKPFVDGFLTAARRHGLETETIALFEQRPSSAGFTVSPEDVARLSARLQAGKFDLVLWPVGPASPEFLDVVPRYPDTTFVFLDWCCLAGTELEGSPNAVALSLRADQAAHLAGYLSALVESRRVLRAHREHLVSIVGADPHFPIVQTWVRGFSEGVHRAVPTMKIRVDYSNDFANRAICERIANRQIDAGSGVVFPAAADCGFGALSAAAVRGVWGVGVDEDRSYLGSHILASAIKRWDRLVELSVGWYLDGSLPRGEDVELGLADDAVGLAGISPEVPANIRKQVEQEAARLRTSEPTRHS
jgi:DNA-binding SARP family transcriptional activator/basic membrane lipoprotein Med (substrate-binding protein (PBP1-ABC) superfamily)